MKRLLPEIATDKKKDDFVVGCIYFRNMIDRGILI